MTVTASFSSHTLTRNIGAPQRTTAQSRTITQTQRETQAKPIIDNTNVVQIVRPSNKSETIVRA